MRTWKRRFATFMETTGSQEQEKEFNPAFVGRAVLGRAVLDMQLDPSLRFPGENRRSAIKWWQDGLEWVLDDSPHERGFIFWCRVWGQPSRVVRAKILANLAEKNAEWSWLAVAKIAEKLAAEINEERKLAEEAGKEELTAETAA